MPPLPHLSQYHHEETEQQAPPAEHSAAYGSHYQPQQQANDVSRVEDEKAV